MKDAKPGSRPAMIYKRPLSAEERREQESEYCCDCRKTHSGRCRPRTEWNEGDHTGW